MGRFKKHFKGVCWKRKSSDSDVEDDSEKQKTPNGEPSSAKGKKKAQRPLKKDEPNKQVIDLDLHVPKAVKDELDRLERLGALNMESINKFVGTLKFDRHKKLLRLVGECEDDKKEPKLKKVQHVSVNPDLMKNEPRISEIQLPQRVDVKQRADEDIPVLLQEHFTMPYLQRDNMFSVIHDFPDDEPACVVDESVYVNNIRANRSLREMGTLTNDTRVTVVSTCSGPDAPFFLESGNILVTPVVMKSTACETEYLDESRKWSNPVVIDNGVKVMKNKPSHTEMKSIAVNTEVVQPTKTGQPLSGLFNPTKVWNLTPFDVYCKRVSVPEPEPLRDGETPYRCLFARPASKSRLSRFNLQIPRAFANVIIPHTVEENSANGITANSEGRSLIDKGGTDTTALDIDGVAPHMFGPKPTSDELKTSHINELDKQQLLEPIHVPRLGMLCRKMLFNDTAHAPNEAGVTIGSYKLSELVMAYTNAAQERLNVDTHTSCERKMIVMPLREMCRQLLGVSGMAKEIPIIALNMENGFGSIAKPDYTAEGYKECFRPDLNNLGIDKGQFGGMCTAYGNLKFPQVQLMAVVPRVPRSVPTLINIQQLRLICSKMLFDDLLLCSSKDKSAAGSYKLSDLSMAYLNAAYQRLKAGTRCISDGNTTIYPLRVMCRQLLDIVLSKQSLLNGFDMGNGCDLDVRPDVFKNVGGITGVVYFGPELPNADLNEDDSFLMPRYGATVTLDGGLKDQRSEVMAVVPYIARSEPMLDDLKAKYNGEVEKRRVVEPIHISQLRVLCRKVFFDEIPHASNQAESAAASYRLSGLALTYINDVKHRLEGGIHHMKVGKMVVMPLREMCRQLLGVSGLAKESPIIDLNNGNGFGNIAKKDYTADGYQECFRPELNNVGMDKTDGHYLLDYLPVKGKFGGVGTAYDNLKFPQVQLMAVVPNVSGPEPTLINIQQLRLICRIMFFDDLLHCSNKDKSDAGSYKLSDLSMSYLNAAYQRLKAGTRCISDGNTTIYPLREMCRQPLGIVLSQQGLLNGLNVGNGCDLDVRPDAFKVGGCTVYFGPDLPNAYLNEDDSVLVPRYGATVTSDGGLKDQRSEVMAVVPYIARSEPMHDDLKAKYNGEVEKRRVVEPIHISHLRVLCRKVFFDEIPHASNQAECAAASYKLSGLAMTYINAVQHRLKGGIQHIKVGNMMVLPLREMCRQLFDIGRLRVEGKFCDTPISNENVRSPKRKLVDHADYTMTKAKQPSRIPKLVLPTIEKGLTTPVGPITLKYLMEKYGASGTFKEIHVKFVCYNLLEGLKFLHKKGIAYKFISPRRIAINSNGYPRLMSDNEVVGPKIQPRIEFSSPELITSGPITTATDIFQVGLLAYTFMYGRSPYKAITYSETKMNLLDDNFTPQFENASMSRDGRYFIKKCLRKDPGMRFSFIKCKRSLEYVVNWFYEFKGEDLANQNFISPFKDLV